MKKSAFISFLSLCVIPALTSACSKDSQSTFYPDDLMENEETVGRSDSSDPSDDTGADPSDLIFEDDFEGTSSIPDPSKWVLCKKASSNWARYLSESYDQAYQKDGILYLVAEQKDGEYLTAGIETRGLFDFQYGRVECRARFDRMPQGNHSGIWMMPAPPAQQWPKSGEIDIMEHLNQDNIIYQTVHSWYADDMGYKDDPKAQGTAQINKDDWNVYGVEWTPTSITYTVNGEKYLSYPNLHLEGEDGSYQWPFSHPFYLILSQSLGGEDTWAGPIDDAELPAIFQIDWIRVYQTPSSSSVTPVYPD